LSFLNKILKDKLNKKKKKIELEEELWNQERPLVEKQNNLIEDKKRLSLQKKRIKFPSWSKLLLIILLINFTALEIFTGWVTIQSFALAALIGTMPDFTPLITLMGAVIGETLSYGIYCAKSKTENIQNGIVYETTMYNLKHQNNNEENTPCG